MATAAQLLVEVGADTKRAESNLRGFGGVVNDTAGFMRTAIGTATGFIIAQPIINGLGSAFDFVKSSAIDFNSQLEQAKIGFTTMLGSGTKAKKLLDDLGDFAARTPFNFQELIPAAQRMLAFGFQSKKVIPFLTAIGDSVAALGGDAAMVDRVTTALGQMKAKGKASADEMLQLTEAGIPAWDLLAKGIGKSTSETMKLVERGLIPADRAIDIITDGMEKRFGGLMDKQSHTFQGAMSNIHDSLQKVLSGAFLPFFEMVADGANKLADFLSTDQFKSFASGATSAIGDVTRLIGKGLLGAVRGTQYWIDKAKITWFQLVDDFNRGIGPLGNLRDIFGEVSQVSMTFGFGGLQVIRDGIQKVQPKARDLADILQNSLGAAFGNVTGWIKDKLLPKILELEPKFEKLGEKAGDLAGHLFDLAQGAALFGDVVLNSFIIPVGEAAIPVLADLAGWLTGKLGDAFDFLGPKLSGMGDAIGGFALAVNERLGPALTNIGNFFQDHGSQLEAIWGMIWPHMESALEGFFNIAAGIVGVGFSLVTGVVKGWLDIIGGNFVQAEQDALDTLGGLKDGVLLILKGLFQLSIGQLFLFVGDWLGMLGNLLGGTVGHFSSLGPKISTAIAGIPAMLGGKVTGWFDSMIAAVKSNAGRLQSAFGNAVHGAVASVPGVTGHFPGFASGTGPSGAPGGYAVVGERGPELIYLPQHSQVVPMARGGGHTSAGVPVVHQYNFAAGSIVASGASPREIMEFIEQEAEYKRLAYGG